MGTNYDQLSADERAIIAGPEILPALPGRHIGMGAIEHQIRQIARFEPAKDEPLGFDPREGAIRHGE